MLQHSDELESRGGVLFLTNSAETWNFWLFLKIGVRIIPTASTPPRCVNAFLTIQHPSWVISNNAATFRWAGEPRCCVISDQQCWNMKFLALSENRRKDNSNSKYSSTMCQCFPRHPIHLMSNLQQCCNIQMSWRAEVVCYFWSTVLKHEISGSFWKSA